METTQNYTLFQRKGSNRWHVRFSIRGQGQQRIALGTDIKADAEKIALAEWHKSTVLAEAGLSVTRKAFEIIAEEFVDTIILAVNNGEKAEYHAKQYPPIIRKYFVGYFGKKQMTAIKSGEIEAYWQWRKAYWITGEGSKNPYIRYERKIKGKKVSIRRPVKEGQPSDSTLNKEALLLKQLFQFGQLHGYTLDIPVIKAPKSKKRTVKSRPGFTFKEFKHLLDVSEERIESVAASSDDQNGTPNEVIYFDRLKLDSFCKIAGYTGMRPTELFNLNWGDIDSRLVDIGKNHKYEAIVIQARGKGKERELAAMPEAMISLNILRTMFPLFAGREPNDNDPVFFNNKGERIRSFKKGLASLLEAAGLRRSADGRLRDSFSFRHLYITQQIREGVGLHLISRNTGTSTKMIDTYYSKIQPTEEIIKLTPDWSKKRPF